MIDNSVSNGTVDSDEGDLYTLSNLNDHPVYLVFRMILAFISITGNILILYVSCRYKDFRKSNTNCLISLLAFGDLCVGIGLFVRGCYTIQIIVHQLQIYDSTFCIWMSLPQVFGLFFCMMQYFFLALYRFLVITFPMKYGIQRMNKYLCISVISGILLPILMFVTALFSDVKSKIHQCSPGAASRMFDKVTSMIGLIHIASIIVLSILALHYLRRTKVPAYVNNLNIKKRLKAERKVVTYVTVILATYLVLCGLTGICLFILEISNMSPIVLGYFSTFTSIGSAVNSCIGFFVYLRMHGELQAYFQNILPTRLFEILSGQKNTETNVGVIQSSNT